MGREGGGLSTEGGEGARERKGGVRKWSGGWRVAMKIGDVFCFFSF